MFCNVRIVAYRMNDLVVISEAGEHHSEKFIEHLADCQWVSPTVKSRRLITAISVYEEKCIAKR